MINYTLKEVAAKKFGSKNKFLIIFNEFYKYANLLQREVARDKCRTR